MAEASTSWLEKIDPGSRCVRAWNALHDLQAGAGLCACVYVCACVRVIERERVREHANREPRLHGFTMRPRRG
jgi:hypothetical protein